MTGAFDPRDPFRFTLESEPDSDAAAVILMMDAPTSPLVLRVHRTDPGGNRLVSAYADDRTVLYRTVVTPKQYAEVLVSVEEYNADPVAGWEKLRTQLAAENIGVLDDALVTDMSPFTLLRFESLDWYSQQPPSVTHARHEQTRNGHVVHGVTVRGFVRLYAGHEEPTAEVERFNRDPEDGFAKLWAAAVTERITQRRTELERLAAEQFRDLRRVETSLRTRRATG